MPEPSATSIEQRVAALIGQHHAELEQLVRQALDVELERLVGLELQRLAGTSTNGANGAPPRPPCSRCGNEPRLPGRTIGLSCKRAADATRARTRKRERRAPAAAASDGGDGPRPDGERE